MCYDRPIITSSAMECPAMLKKRLAITCGALLSLPAVVGCGGAGAGTQPATVLTIQKNDKPAKPKEKDIVSLAVSPATTCVQISGAPPYQVSQALSVAATVA